MDIDQQNDMQSLTQRMESKLDSIILVQQRLEENQARIASHQGGSVCITLDDKSDCMVYFLYPTDRMSTLGFTSHGIFVNTGCAVPPTFSTEIVSPYVDDVGKKDNRLVLLIDNVEDIALAIKKKIVPACQALGVDTKRLVIEPYAGRSGRIACRLLQGDPELRVADLSEHDRRGVFNVIDFAYENFNDKSTRNIGCGIPNVAINRMVHKQMSGLLDQILNIDTIVERATF